jgi:glutathione S-transferase
MVKLHGSSMSRSGRCLWALEEVGVKFEHIPTAVPQAKSPEHLKVNPNGHIPALEDEGQRIWESMAINLYLAEKYGKAPLWPSTVEGHAGAYQWSFWAMTETEPHLITILQNRMFRPKDQQDQKAVGEATKALAPPYKVLDDHLKTHEYLLGKDFTIADLNVASVLSLGNLVGVDMSATPKAQAWLAKCTSRPANQKASQYK